MKATTTRPQQTAQIDPLAFFGKLKWLDGRTPLMTVIDPYRQALFTQALYTFTENGWPEYNLVLAGRGKKNWKSADLILAALYKAFAWRSPGGNQAYIIANDAEQAADDLQIAKLLVRANPLLAKVCTIRKNKIVRKDGMGFIEILPARDIAGAHGKTFCFIGYDEIHEYRSWDLMEALQPDPTRPDALQWITSYASIFNYPSIPLFDLCEIGKAKRDPRMVFSWYAADYCTDPTLADASPEHKANPSMASWKDTGYLEQQRVRLPSHKFRRLHLNLPGLPEGGFLDPQRVDQCIERRRGVLPYREGISYAAFVDMSGGTVDDASLAIGHRDGERIIIDLVMTQGHPTPFDPREAVDKFAGVCARYRIRKIVGDRYAGQTFKYDFERYGIVYEASPVAKTGLYESLEPPINAGQIVLPDDGELHRQLTLLIQRGRIIDHPSGESDDKANAVAGIAHLLAVPMVETTEHWYLDGKEITPGHTNPDDPYASENEEELNRNWVPL